MEEAKGFYHKLFVIDQKVGVFFRVQQDSPALSLSGRAVCSPHACPVFQLLRRTLVCCRHQLVDHVREDQLRVREVHGSPDEVPEAHGAVDLHGLPGDRGATLQADGAEEAGEAKEVVAMKMCDEDLGDSPFRLRGKKIKLGTFQE